jgi:peroxiredoxin
MRTLVALLVSCLLLSTCVLIADDESSALDDFQRFVRASDPMVAREVSKRDHPGPLSKQEAEEFEKGVTHAAVAVLDRARELEKRFPQSTRLPETRDSLKKTLSMVFGFMGLPIPVGRAADVEVCTRELLRAGGKDVGLHLVLFRIAASLPNDQQRARFEELSHELTSEPACSMAKAALRNLDRLGLPLELSFTAVDGRVVSPANLKGKVVIIDFWAPSCGPCVRELAGFKEVYRQYKAQGLEIIGISKDPDEKALKRFLEKQPLPWPVKYDGTASPNRVAQAYGIEEIPVVWLVDRHGLLRELNGREDQERKIAALLKER